MWCFARARDGTATARARSVEEIRECVRLCLARFGRSPRRTHCTDVRARRRRTFMRAGLVLVATASLMVACGGMAEDGPDFGRIPPPLVFEQQLLSRGAGHHEAPGTPLFAGAHFVLIAQQPDLDV